MRRRSRKKRLGFISKSFLLLTLLSSALLLLSYTASVVDPAIFWPIAFLGLAYPWLLMINLALMVIWLFTKPLFSFIPLISILIGWNFLLSTVGFRESSAITVPKSSKNLIRVMNYNVHYFKKFEDKNDKQVKDLMLNLIREEQPDVICIEEYMTHRKGEYDQTRELKKILQTEQYYFEPSMDDNFEATGLAIFSKYKIKDTGHILFPNTARGNEAIYVDLEFRNKLFRVYNVHLQSISFQPEDYQYMKKITSQEIADVNSSRRIGSRLKQAFIKRSEQARLLKEHTKNCNIPFIIAGDFNDTPVSFAVHTISKGLKNSFYEKGSGFGITYNGDFPNFQIDYILTTPDFKVKNYQIINKKLSDHYPVRVDLELEME